MSRRDDWYYRGRARPAFAIDPAPDQESVWDYPRPPAIEADGRRVTVRLAQHPVADTVNAYRVLETAGAPTFYLPRKDVDPDVLIAGDASSFCEWKGRARYWHVVTGRHRRDNAAWAYPDADRRFAVIAGYLAFYAGLLDCRVDDERVQAQPGGFYGGWVTREIVGPFKGEPGTEKW